MSITDNIRKRRQNRMRELLEQQEGQAGASRASGSYGQAQNREAGGGHGQASNREAGGGHGQASYRDPGVRQPQPPVVARPNHRRAESATTSLPQQGGAWSVNPNQAYPGANVADDRLLDPEYVWKQRERELFGSGTATPLAAGKGSEREEQAWKEWNSPPSPSQLRWKLIVCVFAFAAVWLLFQSRHPVAITAQQHVRTALQEDIDFSRAAAWYSTVFDGAPSFIPTFDSLSDRFSAAKPAASLTQQPSLLHAPVLGVVTLPFQQSHAGIRLQTASGAPVQALDQGRVTYVGFSEATGLTVIIQHPNYLQSISGLMEESMVSVNDWVQGGQQIGTVAKNGDQPKAEFYYAIKKQNRYLNPNDVISFD